MFFQAILKKLTLGIIFIYCNKVLDKNDVDISAFLVSKVLKEQLSGKQFTDTAKLRHTAEELEGKLEAVKEEQMHLYGVNKKNQEAKRKMKDFFERQKDIQKRYEMISNLSRTANGSLSGTAKIDFETYIQRQYFRQIIHAANKRLLKMTSGEFILQC